MEMIRSQPSRDPDIKNMLNRSPPIDSNHVL